MFALLSKPRDARSVIPTAKTSTGVIRAARVDDWRDTASRTASTWRDRCASAAARSWTARLPPGSILYLRRAQV